MVSDCAHCEREMASVLFKQMWDAAIVSYPSYFVACVQTADFCTQRYHIVGIFVGNGQAGCWEKW